MSLVEGTQVGQRVMVDILKHPLPPEFVKQKFEVAIVDGDGDKALVRLKGPKGLVKILGITEQFFADELLPASADLDPGDLPRIVEREVHMSAETKLMNLATTIAKTERISLARATAKASQQLTADELEEYRGGSPAPAREPARSLNMNERPGVTRLRAEAERLVRERGVSPDDAVDEVLREHLPDAGAVRFSERVTRLKAGGLDDLAALMRASHEDPAGAEAYRLAGL